MALQFTNNITSMIVEAGEAVAFEYRLTDMEGNVRDLTGRAFRLTLYNSADRTSYYSEDGAIGEDADGAQFIQWVSDGTLTEGLLERSNIYFEIAERLDNSKVVLSSGTVMVNQSAPDVPTLTGAPVSRYVWRITRADAEDGSGTPTYSTERVRLILVGTGTSITLKALALSTTSFTATQAFSATVQNRTAGSAIRATASDGTTLAVSGSTLSGTFSTAGDKTITLRETLAGAINSPQSTIVPVTVAAAPEEPEEPDTPEEPEEPAQPEPDLSSPATVYGDPGTVFPLNIHLANPANAYTLMAPSGITLVTEATTTEIQSVSSRWTTDASGAATYAPSGDAVDSSVVLRTHNNPGNANGYVLLGTDQWVDTGSLGLVFEQTSDPATTQTPPSIKMSFKGKAPNNGVLLAEIYGYNVGGIKLSPTWQRNGFQFIVRRGSGEEQIYSDDIPSLSLGSDQLYEVEWVDNPGGVGGTATFYVDGVKAGASKTTTMKPRIDPGMAISCNASLGNSGGSSSNYQVDYLGVSVGKPVPISSYVPLANGTVTPSQLTSVLVDARALTQAQAKKTVTYATVGGIGTTSIDVIVGEMTVPAGQAYKAVLEDWSTGSPVVHANELVMTKPAAQNVRFEDATLSAQQPAWTELLPKGPVPSINGISYYCEGIRIGEYTALQFGYDWSPDYMPNAPFGDPQGKETYMVPHKWAIYDSEGTLLGRVEKPNGQPLNGTDTKSVWEGNYDGRSVAIITDDNPHYPHGTVRSGVIWRSSDPVAYTQADVLNQMPVYDFRVPFASQTGYSVNGFDLRIYSGGQGGDGQSNGFGNFRWMSWEPTTYEGIKAQVAATKNPYKVGATDIGTTPNAGLWLKYTPFNIQGRGPISGPGGTRDDRQPMPEPVARYARDVASTRPHDGRSMRDIALSYLTGYVSDPVHTFKNGRLTPLWKGEPRAYQTMRNHYYGPGRNDTPAGQALYVQGGRLYEWTDSQNPLRAKVPYAGKTATKPYFGTFQIDVDHSEFYPHWGSMLFKSPEFAMLGHRFWDMSRLYSNDILSDVGSLANRGPAWQFLHAALAWKTASASSSRLYNRDEILDFVTFDFEAAYDRWFAADLEHSVLNPPTNILNGDGSINTQKAALASLLRFGPSFCEAARGTYCHDFMTGYWLQSLHIAEKNGFNDALRAASTKAGEIIDFLLEVHAKRVVGRLLDGYAINAIENTDYLTPYWTPAQITAAGGEVTQLPQTFAEIAAAQTVTAPGWDSFTSTGGTSVSRDGQSMDQLLGAPGLLIDMGVADDRLQEAADVAETRFQAKLTAEMAKGPTGAGSGWFVYHQATCNRPYLPD